MANYGFMMFLANEDNFSTPVVLKMKDFDENTVLDDEASLYFESLGYKLPSKHIGIFRYNGKKYYELFADNKVPYVIYSNAWEINPAWLIMFKNKDIYKELIYSDECGYSITEHLDGTTFSNDLSTLNLITTVGEAKTNIRNFKEIFYSVNNVSTSAQEEIIQEVCVLEEYLYNFHDNDLVIVDYAELLLTFDEEDLSNYNEIEDAKRLLLMKKVPEEILAPVL